MAAIFWAQGLGFGLGFKGLGFIGEPGEGGGRTSTKQTKKELERTRISGDPDRKRERGRERKR